MPARAGQIVETAFAMPRTAPAPVGTTAQPAWNNDEVAAVRPLSSRDAVLSAQIFALQQQGAFDRAATLTRELANPLLLGQILAQRYLAAEFRPDAASLRTWLQHWPGLADAASIKARLAILTHAKLPVAVTSNALEGEPPASVPPEEADPAEHAFTRNPMLDRTVALRVAEGDRGARSALRLVARTRFINTLYAATLRAEIAQIVFTQGGDDMLAISTARTALIQSSGRVGLAGFVAGLASWRQGRLADAGAYFALASQASLTASSTRAGAAFWAARVRLRQGDARASDAWLRRAASSGHTFYGILAGRVLDHSTSPIVAASDSVAIHPGAAVLGEADTDAVAANPQGAQAFALLEIGEKHRAEMELRALWPQVQNDAALSRSIELVADASGMTDFAAQLATILQSRDGKPRDEARFPMPVLRPRNGFTVNPALVYALTRLESNFNNRAVSGAGAHGLMQVMPVTATFLLGKNHYQRGALVRDTSGNRRSVRRHRTLAPHGIARDLHDPAINLQVGQHYLTYLAAQDGIGNNLIRLLASYNAGPTELAHWNDDQSRRNETDPLMFMETIPVRETRDFVHRALCYLWIYDVRMALPAPALDRLAQGGWPQFDQESRVGIYRAAYLRPAR